MAVGDYRVTNKELRIADWESEIVISKDAFVECYKRWILEESESKEKHLARVGDLKPGEVFELAGIQWEILDDECSTPGVFCLAKDILFGKAFDENNHNDWRNSTLREYLNGEFKEQLVERIGKNPFKLFYRDLMSDDGMTNYGSSADFISLLSDEEYRKYRKYISNKSNMWWTLTPHSCLKEYSSYVQTVYSDGSLSNFLSNFSVYDKCGGVVPVILLDSKALVYVGGIEND